MRNIELPEVAPGDEVLVSGSACSIIVHGDVGEDARLRANGGSATITVEGYVHAHADLRANGGAAKVVVKGGADPTAKIRANGGGAEVKIFGKGPTERDRSSKRFKAEQRERCGPPFPPRPPRPPKPPRMPDFSGLLQTLDDIVIETSGQGQSVSIVNGEVFINGKKVGEDSAPKDNEDHHRLQVQKSTRPRELWGT